LDVERHYVILPSVHRLRGWAQDNITEEWSQVGATVRTADKEYRAVTALHHLRGATVTIDTLHWATGWYMGRTAEMNVELERYAEMALVCGELRK
jgi:hypothetical protein